MDRLAGFLGSHAAVGLDTPLFIYHLEDVAPYAAVTGAILASLVEAEFLGVTSVISLMEITVQPLARGLIDVATEYESAISRLPNLTVAAITRSAARQAAELRAAYRIRPADALQMGACLTHGATGFITNDRDLTRVRELDVLVLADITEAPRTRHSC